MEYYLFNQENPESYNFTGPLFKWLELYHVCCGVGVAVLSSRLFCQNSGAEEGLVYELLESLTLTSSDSLILIIFPCFSLYLKIFSIYHI